MTDQKVEVSQCDRDAADEIAVRVLNNYRRRDGLTSYVYDDNRKRDEKHIKEAFAEIVAPAFARHRTRALEATQSPVGREALPLVEAIATWERDNGTLAAIMPEEYEGFMDKLKLAAVRGSARAALTTQPQTEAGEPVAWVVEHPDYPKDLAFLPLLQGDKDAGWTETPLYTTPSRIEAAQVDVDANRKVALRNLEKSGLRFSATPTEPAEGDLLAEALEALRADEWLVAVHNDYRLNGEFHTFWLFTHPDGKWIKGEGQSDIEAIRAAILATGERKP